MNGLQIHQIVVPHINTHTEIQTSVSPVHDLVIPEFHKVRVLGIPYGNTCVHLRVVG